MDGKCKICGSSLLKIFEHTARCQTCGIILYYPYPESHIDVIESEKGKEWCRNSALQWYSNSSFYNHSNFTNMIRFAMDESYKWRELRVLDYGGGGGQFAFVFKSHFPQSTVYITDINDNRLLDEWRRCNRQIPFEQFPSDQNTYDFIFMCDVFEHISDPTSTLLQLICKLNDNGKIFIDTPKYFWLYPILQRTSKHLYSKLLKGTVSMAHLQLWSKESFYMVVKEAGLAVTKYSETSEFTMPADFYLHNMGINNKLLRIIGRLFYKSSKVLVRNKIMSVLSKPDQCPESLALALHNW